MKLLLADDEQPLVNFIERGLTAEGHECVCVTELHQLTAVAKQQQPDVMVLDRMFGDEDSLLLIPTLRRQVPAARILLLSALDDVTERVNGLKQGADDYLCKPFDFDELVARIEVLNRRHSAEVNAATLLSTQQLTLDLDSRIARLRGEELSLTKLEFDLLRFFMEQRDKVLSRERILSRVWGSHADPLTNIVDVYISRLRQKLDTPHTPSYIQTLRGNGYRFRDVAIADEYPK